MQIDLQSVYSFHQIGGRDNQEDSRYPDTDVPSITHSVFVVCDGVGGAAKGEVASSVVCSSIATSTKGCTFTAPFTDHDFQTVLSEAYKTLDDISDESNTGMGTTLTFLAFNAQGALAAHIGDSRIYQIRPGEGIMYRSEDHSLVNALLRSGNISPDQVKDHPRANVITRCMSAATADREHDDATVVTLTDIAPGDYFLLCSDGVVHSIDEDDLVNLLSTDSDDKSKCDALASISATNADNNTAILIHVGLVTVDAQPHNIDTDDTTESVGTSKLPRIDNSTHDISPKQTKSFFKTIFNKIFK